MVGQLTPRGTSWVTVAAVAATVAATAVGGVIAASPASAATALASTTVDDAVTSGASHFSYTGAWSVCTGCRSDATGNAFHYSNRRGATVRLTFTGVRATIYGLRQHAGGIATVTLDGRSKGTVNLASSRTGLVAVYTTPTLKRGPHTLTLTVTSRSTGRGHTVGIDRAVVTDVAPTQPKPPAPQPPAPQPPAQQPQPPAPQPPAPQPPAPQPPAPQPPSQVSGSGVASLSFDDGQLGQFENAAPVLRSAGFHGTYYIVTDAMGWGGSSMSAAQVRQLAGEGNEIGSHTKDHAHLTSLSSDQVDAEFATSVSALRSQAGVTPTTCAYPYGDVNASVEAIAAKYFAACRGTGSGTNGSGTDAFNLRVFYVHTSTTAADVRAAADAAKAAGAWIVFVYHGVGSVQSADDVTASQFAGQVDAIKASGIAVRTVAQAHAGH